MPAFDPNNDQNQTGTAPQDLPAQGGVDQSIQSNTPSFAAPIDQNIPAGPPLVYQQKASEQPLVGGDSSAVSDQPAQTSVSVGQTPDASQPTASSSGGISDNTQTVVPPPPPPTLPPQEVFSQTPPVVQADQQPQAPTSSDTVVMPPAPKRSLATLLIVLAVILLLSIGGFLVYKYVLPMLSGSGGGEKTIVWWGLWEDDSIVESLIAEYEQSNPGVTINYQRQLSTDYRERLTNELAKGTGPDIFRFHNSWMPMFTDELDTVPASVMNAADFSQNYYPVISSDLASGTGFVGIPLYYDALMLYVNEELFEASGRTVPETWDDLRKTALELTVIGENGQIVQSGVPMGRTENVDHWQEILALLMIQNGVNLSNPTGVLAEDALAFFTLFSTVDGVWDETLPPSTAAFANGKVAMYLAPSWRYFEIKQANPSLKFKTYKVPQLPKDSPSDPDITYASYWVEGVWSRSKNRLEAWSFLKFISTPESLEKLYANASRVRAFGEPYPRLDMQNLLLSSPEVGPLAAQAGGARSWYLYSRTFDGPTGINSQLSKYFEDAVNAANEGRDPDDLLPTVANGVAQVLNQYSAR